MGQKNVFRQLLLGGDMTKIMAEVRKVRLSWTEPFGESDAFEHIHVGRVSPAAGGPENQGLNAFENPQSIGINRFAVAQVRGDGAIILAEQKTEHVGVAMFHLDRMDFRMAQKKGALNQMRFREHVPGKLCCSVECVGETFLQALHGFAGRVDGDGTTIRRSEPSKIIETHDMIGMRMRIKDRIESLYSLTEGLDSELGAGIHDPGAVGGLHIDR